MHPRVAVATAPAARLGVTDTDRPFHEAAARAAGIDLHHVVWSDPHVAWSSYDLVVVRSTWDYLDHLEAFGDWLDRFGVGDPLLYARIDLVTLDDGTDAVLEVALAEPSFFLDVEPSAATRFAQAVVRRVPVA